MHTSFLCGYFRTKFLCVDIFNTYDMLLQETGGFEPPVARATTDFKSAAINHSAMSPIIDGPTGILTLVSGFKDRRPDTRRPGHKYGQD